jgi:hypothetical protein
MGRALLRGFGILPSFHVTSGCYTRLPRPVRA